MPVENEVKLRVADAAAARQRILDRGYSVLHPRIDEVNIVCDTPDAVLRNKRSLLRVRTAGETTTVTFKGPAQDGPHKTREEIEFTASNPQAVQLVLERLGFVPVFKYEKYRTEFAKPNDAGVVTLDETPIGAFLELEGPAAWLDAAARELGFSPADYIKESYGGLYIEYLRHNSTAPRDMVFTK